MEEMYQERSSLSHLHEKLNLVRDEIKKVIVGQDEIIDLLLVGILSDGHILIEGVPGVAKTLTAKLIARIIDVNFSRIQFTPDLMPGDVLGTNVYNQREGIFNFKPGPVFSNIVLIDEINRAPAKTQSALFEVMEERQVTVDGITHKMQFPFMVMATQNPIEQEGTYRLPEAQLDRFLFKLNMNYPSLEEEVTILERQQGKHQAQLLEAIGRVLSTEDVHHLREIASGIMIERPLINYIAQVVNETRNNPGLYLGASTRASLALLKASKALAALRGRDFVIPEDIADLAPSVLRHRVVLTPEKEMEGSTADDIIEQILKSVQIPR